MDRYRRCFTKINKKNTKNYCRPKVTLKPLQASLPSLSLPFQPNPPSSSKMSSSNDYVPVDSTTLIMDGWFHERGPLWPGQAMSLRVQSVVHHSRSPYQDILIFDSTDHGRVLVLDGVIQVTERDEFAYQEMISHLPLYGHPCPRRVLVIGGGDGGVLREVAKHSCVESITLCEIDSEVIRLSKEHLPQLSVGYGDPRVEVKVMDGNVFMAANPGTFDVIITDSSDPIGPAGVLFETPFYDAMYQALAPGGVVCTQGENFWLHTDLIKPLIDGIKGKYSTVEYANISIPTYPSGGIGFIIGTKGREGDGVRRPKRREEAREVVEGFKYYDHEVHEAAFVLPAFARKAIYGE